jgi:hypothetical protein
MLVRAQQRRALQGLINDEDYLTSTPVETILEENLQNEPPSPSAIAASRSRSRSQSRSKSRSLG